jgi:hypothetical protein
MLFSVNELKKSQVPDRPILKAAKSEGSNLFYLTPSGVNIREAIPDIQPDTTYHVPCFVNWSLHDVLEHLLVFTGPADVCMTSWAISEDPVRKIVSLIHRGAITSFNAIFDERVRQYCPAAMQLADSQLGKIKLTGIHAKILVITNQNYGISVTSTANATNKKRIEKYVISTHRRIAEFDRKWILQTINSDNPYVSQ